MNADELRVRYGVEFLRSYLSGIEKAGRENAESSEDRAASLYWEAQANAYKDALDKVERYLGFVTEAKE